MGGRDGGTGRLEDSGTQGPTGGRFARKPVERLEERNGETEWKTFEWAGSKGMACLRRATADRCRKATYSRSPSKRSRAYLINVMSLNIGMYREIRIPPTISPMKAIISGSMRAVRDSTIAPTSSS